MSRFPFWFAEALIEYRKARPLPPARKSVDTNAFDRVFWEIGLVLAVALGVAAFAEVVLRTNGIG